MWELYSKYPMKKIIWFQFGDSYQRRAAGYQLQTALYHNAYHLWATKMRDGAHLNVDEPLLEGFVKNQTKGEFWIGLSAGTYEVTIVCYDPAVGHGPFSVSANGVEKLKNYVVSANEIVERTFTCEPRDGVLKLEFTAGVGGDFLINGMRIAGPDNGKILPIFKAAPANVFPEKEELNNLPDVDPKDTLHRICEWFLGRQEPGGFLGEVSDYTANRPIGYWYTASFPLRTLLAGYEILGESKFLNGALRCLDMFVGEQLPNGSWMGHLRRRPTKDLTKDEIETILKKERMPLSDIGSVVSALAVGTALAGPDRGPRYLDALERFCNDWAMKFILPNGTFSDGYSGYEGLYREIDAETYTCATTIEAAAFSLVSKVTGKPQYQQVADRALQGLLPDWRADGRILGRYSHWCVRNRLPFIMDPLYFGDQYYYDEGFITTARHTRDEKFRRQLHEVIKNRVYGTCGLMATLGDRTWWPMENADIWNRAKSAGMPQTLLYARACGVTLPRLEKALDHIKKILCLPKYAQFLGIMPEDSERPATKYAYFTWSGMQQEATGFAGMTLAEMIKPGVLYLDAVK